MFLTGRLNKLYTLLSRISNSSILSPLGIKFAAKRALSSQIDVLKDELFMNKYYDNTMIPKEKELDISEFQTRLESWASYRMFSGVKMRRNGDWYSYYKDILDGPYETSVAAAKKWDDLCYSAEHDVTKLNFPEKYWMRGEGLPNVNFFGSRKKTSVDWVPPTAKKVRDYGIDVQQGKPLSLKETMNILKGEGALNIRVLNMRDHSSMASYMLFVTGSTINHQKRIGDTIVHYLRKRQLKSIPIRVTDRDESEWMVVDGDSIITNIFSPRFDYLYNSYTGYRMARDLEDQWELMRPGKTRYEDWTNEQLQEKFGNVEEKIEAMSLENIIQTYQQNIETECHQPANPFQIDESIVDSLKEEIKEEAKETEMDVNDIPEKEETDMTEYSEETESNDKKDEPSTDDLEYETKDYYMTREDFEKMKNDDGTITVNGQRLKIEDIMGVAPEEIVDKEVQFLEVKEDEKKEAKRKRRKELKNNNSRSH